MANNSINIDHSSSSINTGDLGYIILSKNGAVKIGNGTTIPETDLSSYEGMMRYNEQTKRLEFCDGVTWNELLIDNEEDLSSVYSLIF